MENRNTIESVVKYTVSAMKDFYKADHKSQYPENTTKVYSNFTPRSTKYFKDSTDNKIVVFGIQAMLIDFLIEDWNSFFISPKQNSIAKYKHLMDSTLGKDVIQTKHLEELYDLGYLPLHIKAIEEGKRVQSKIPVLTITNTNDKFYWLVNYLETVISTELWKPMTMATVAFEFRKLFESYAKETSTIEWFVPFQGHDFSMRGLANRFEAFKNSIAHLTCFVGTDTIPAIDGAEYFYPNDDDSLIGTSVFASEHSTITMQIHDVLRKNNLTDTLENRRLAEEEVLKYMLTKVYPQGIYSHVSDSYDYWYLLSNTLPKLKNIIENREDISETQISRLVIRPDSGDPEKVICGYNILDADDDNMEVNTTDSLLKKLQKQFQKQNYYDAFKLNGKIYDIKSLRILSKEEAMGSLRTLYSIFGGKKNDKGYIDLNSKIGLIYGDSITLERAKKILERMKYLGFSSTNVVFGIGSYSYQYMTRDTLGFAMKATYGEVNGKGINIFKEPKTDSGTKKSAKGLLYVDYKDNEYVLYDQVSPEKESDNSNQLKTVFLNGELIKKISLNEIRENIKKELEK